MIGLRNCSRCRDEIAKIYFGDEFFKKLLTIGMSPFCQIAEMENPNHRIRDLVQRRIVDFAKQAISASRSAPLQVSYQCFTG